MRGGLYLPAVAAFGAGAFFPCCAWPAAGITSANSSAQPRFANRFGISRSPSSTLLQLYTLEIQELRFFSWQPVNGMLIFHGRVKTLGVIHLRFIPDDPKGFHAPVEDQ